VNHVRLQGKVAAITGSGRGIGRAAAELFAREGARVAILEVDEDSGKDSERAISDAGGTALFIRTDVADPDNVSASFARIEKGFGSLHVLYNNASIFLGKDDAPIADLSPATWDRVLGANLHGLFHVCKHGIPLIVGSGGGSVINTSSSAGVIGIPGCDAYTASKGATVALTRSMAVEYGPANVRVNCIAPAAIYTDMVRESNLDDPDFDEELFLRTTPVRRWGTPEEIADIALFLASDESSYLNGAIIVADGGITIT
jgi:NAD(P)-dependent dehydrogenase (short-subunit alcohol dehydrogenase family)